jgi:hypothetical protein
MRLFVVSTFGDGEARTAPGFERKVLGQNVSLKA